MNLHCKSASLDVVKVANIEEFIKKLVLLSEKFISQKLKYEHMEYLVSIKKLTLTQLEDSDLEILAVPFKLRLVLFKGVQRSNKYDALHKFFKLKRSIVSLSFTDCSNAFIDSVNTALPDMLHVENFVINRVSYSDETIITRPLRLFCYSNLRKLKILNCDSSFRNKIIHASLLKSLSYLTELVNLQFDNFLKGLTPHIKTSHRVNYPLYIEYTKINNHRKDKKSFDFISKFIYRRPKSLFLISSFVSIAFQKIKFQNISLYRHIWTRMYLNGEDILFRRTRRRGLVTICQRLSGRKGYDIVPYMKSVGF